MTTWNSDNQDSALWTNARIIRDTTVPSLFARAVFGRSLFADMPIITWFTPGTEQDTWTEGQTL